MKERVCEREEEVTGSSEAVERAGHCGFKGQCESEATFSNVRKP